MKMHSNGAKPMQILNKLKATWRARRTLIQKQRNARDYFQIEKENIVLKKRNEDLESRIAELEQKLEMQKLIAEKRLKGQQHQKSLKVKANVRGEKRKIEVGKAREDTKRQKTARFEEEKKKKEAKNGKKEAEMGKKEAEMGKKEAEMGKKVALERAKQAEIGLKRMRVTMEELTREWKKKKVKIEKSSEIMLPENPFCGLEEDKWIQAATDAAPMRAREQITKLIQMGRKRLPPDMEKSKVDAALMVYLYTTHAFYADYSRCYRDDTASKEQYKRIHYMILRGLMDRKSTKGSYWRGMNLDRHCKLCLTMFAALADNCRGEHTFSLLTPQSASKQIGTAAAFGSATGTAGKVQVICCFEGAAVDVKEISAYPWEDECVLPPGLAKFLSVCKVGEKYFCHVMMK
jgi:hypothetical protein